MRVLELPLLLLLLLLVVVADRLSMVISILREVVGKSRWGDKVVEERGWESRLKAVQK